MEHLLYMDCVADDAFLPHDAGAKCLHCGRVVTQEQRERTDAAIKEWSAEVGEAVENVVSGIARMLAQLDQVACMVRDIQRRHAVREAERASWDVEE